MSLQRCTQGGREMDKIGRIGSKQYALSGVPVLEVDASRPLSRGEFVLCAQESLNPPTKGH